MTAKTSSHRPVVQFPSLPQSALLVSASKMTQRVKVLAARPNDLSSIPESPKVEGVSWPSCDGLRPPYTCCDIWVVTTYKINK